MSPSSTLALALFLAAPCLAAPAMREKPLRFTEARRKATADYIRERYGREGDDITIEPRIVVLHWTGLPTLEASFNVMNPEELGAGRGDVAAGGRVNVSAHFLVDRDGTVYRLMPETDMARHVIGLNLSAIGIENVGGAGGRDDLTAAQAAANARLVRELKARHPGIEWLVGHHEYRRFEGHPLWREKDPAYRTEKSDPGDRFMKRVRGKVADLGLSGPPALSAPPAAR
jgi:N-acetyl-anhydromuramyl-L-alanine amidase AmpD